MAVAITKTFDATATAATVSNIATCTATIGTAASDRLVVLCVGSETTSASPNSATISFDGNPATAMQTGPLATLGAVYSRVFWYPVPSATSAIFQVTFGATCASTAYRMAAYSVTGSSLNPSSAIAVGDTDADPITCTVAIPTNGGCIAICSDATDTTARTWGGLTADIDTDAGGFRFSTGTSTTGGSTNVSVTGGNGEDAALAVFAFQPAGASFGDILGVSTDATASITNPLSPGYALKVSAGDLVVVSVAEVTNLTSTTCDDALGNTYTALTSSDFGSGSIIAYYSLITVAGFCTPRVTTTAGADDAAIIAVAYKGPFASSPLDINPAVATDSAVSYEANATGTLAQADELLVGYFNSLGQGNFSSPAPSARLDGQIAPSGDSVRLGITSKVVAVTTTVTMGVGGDNSNQTTGCGVATFKKNAGNPVLLATATSFAFTGTNVTLKRNVPLYASATSFAVTGTNVTLQKNIPLHASATSFAVTGTNVTFPRTYKLLASATSFAFTGTNVTLAKGITLHATATSFAFTGTDVTFPRAYKLIASATSFAVTGTNVTLKRNVPLVASATSFAVTGTDVSLKHGYRVLASATSFAVTGTNVTLKRGLDLIASATSFAVTGTNATLKHGYRILASATAFAFTGTDVNLIITAPGQIILPADAGSYLFTGTDVDLTKAGTVTAAAPLYGHWRGPAGGKRKPLLGRTRLLSELDPKKEDELLFTPEEILELEEPLLAPETYEKIVLDALELYETRARTLAIAAEDAAEAKRIADADAARVIAERTTWLAAQAKIRQRKRNNDYIMMMD